MTPLASAARCLLYPPYHRENILFLAHLIFVDPRNFGPQLSLTKINYQSNKLTVTMTETQKTSTTSHHNSNLSDIRGYTKCIC